MKQIKDRIAVVTGAGSGIGRAVSLELARRGADVALVDIDDAGLSQVKAAVEATGRKASKHLVDVSSRQQMEVLPEQVIAAHGAVHILVNNAGREGRFGRLRRVLCLQICGGRIYPAVGAGAGENRHSR